MDNESVSTGAGGESGSIHDETTASKNTKNNNQCFVFRISKPLMNTKPHIHCARAKL